MHSPRFKASPVGGILPCAGKTALEKPINGSCQVERHLRREGQTPHTSADLC